MPSSVEDARIVATEGQAAHVVVRLVEHGDLAVVGDDALRPARTHAAAGQLARELARQQATEGPPAEPLSTRRSGIRLEVVGLRRHMARIAAGLGEPANYVASFPSPRRPTLALASQLDAELRVAQGCPGSLVGLSRYLGRGCGGWVWES
jgi:hypothetical protein